MDNSFEIDSDKYLGRNNFDIPKMISSSENFSNSLDYSINKVVSQKQIFKLEPNSKACINFLISASNSREEFKRV